MNRSAATRDTAEIALPDDPVLDRVLGPRAEDITHFSDVLDGAVELSEVNLRTLFEYSGGRIWVAQEVLNGAHSAGVPIDGIEPHRFSALIRRPPTALDCDPSDDMPALQLLQLLVWLPEVNSLTLRLADSALGLFTARDRAALPILEELVSDLVIAGVLKTDGNQADCYAIPVLIRSLIQRMANPGELDSSPRTALGHAMENTFRSMLIIDRVDLDEILTLATTIANWDLLETIWTIHRTNLFVTHLVAATRAFLSVPDDIISTRPILAIARSSAWQVELMRRLLETDDATQILPAVTFEMLVVPGLAQSAADLESGEFTTDEVIVLTIQSSRTRRLAGDQSAALEAIRLGRKHLLRRVAASGEPSMLNAAELDREHSAALAATGRFSSALQMLKQSIHIAETTAPGAPYPLLAAYASCAQTHLVLGHGVEADQYLRKTEAVADSVGFTSGLARYAAATTELFRRLDEIDLSAAKRLLEESRSARTGFDSETAVLLAEGMFRVYSGQASFAAKAIVESAGGESAWVNDPGLTRDSSRLNLLSFVFLAAGEIKPIQHILARLRPSTQGFSLAKARLSLMLDQINEMEVLVRGMLIDDAGPRLKGCAHALRAAGLQRQNRSAEALIEFDTVLDYCVISSSVLPIAQLPRVIRSTLVERSAESATWNLLAQSFGSSATTGEDLRRRLLELPETMKIVDHMEQVLSSPEVVLLFTIESGKTIPAIAREFGLVEGTVKNRLSALYKKIGVRNRAAAIEYGRSHGYFSHPESTATD